MQNARFLIAEPIVKLIDRLKEISAVYKKKSTIMHLDTYISSNIWCLQNLIVNYKI